MCFLWVILQVALLDDRPVDSVVESGEIPGTIELVIGHEGVLEDIHDEQGQSASGVISLVFVDPHVDEAAGERIKVQDGPADAPHAACCEEIVFPVVERAKLADDGMIKGAIRIDGRGASHVLEIEFVEAHAIELPAEAAL